MKVHKGEVIASSLIIFIFALSFYKIGLADDSLCARVKIEIRQELTLERQAFDAHMRITNGLTTLSIENVKVEVKFMDKDGNPVVATSDPDNTDALFFIRVDTMDGIDDVGGEGVVNPSSTADIHWFIVPAIGAAEDNPRGTLYYVGATLSYTIGGEEHVTDVSPDYIYVKPMPELVLDYFLPKDVYGDDAFTPEIEPPIPFSLGVRVRNNGFGTAHNLGIESAQPKIIENENQLLIGFTITGSDVNGNPGTDSLLVNFGDIDPGKCGTARWIMECSLSGKFVEFTADFVHADEFGGELTSLVQAINTHFLVHDVLVDLPGRDSIKDFLAKDEDVLSVYESDGTDTPVTDQSGLVSLTQDGIDIWDITMPVTDGPAYVKVADPSVGTKVIVNVIRSDGKIIDPANAWISKERNPDHSWSYFLNLFDVNTPGQYRVIMGEADAGPPVPVIEFIPDREVEVGSRISFIIKASNPDGTLPMLSVRENTLPAGATFIDRGDGVGIFDWTPVEAQAGEFEIEFVASNSQYQASRRALITVTSTRDTDHDGLPDSLEDDMCTSPDDPDSDDDGLLDGEEDSNHNGIIDADETDPCSPDSDGDGLLDGTEVRDTGTNPLLADTDGDGWSDNQEVNAGSDPTDPGILPEECPVGDVNCDGSIDVVDLIFTVDVMLDVKHPNPAEFRQADCVEDEIINVQDVQCIVNKILGIGE